MTALNDRLEGMVPIQVAFLTPLLGIGGAERQMLTLAANLPKEAFMVRFLLLSERGPGAAEAEASGAQVHVLGLGPPGRIPRNPARLVGALKAADRYRQLTADVDIVDAWLTPSMIFAAIAQPLARVPVLIGGRRNLSDLYERKSWLRRTLATHATRRMDAVVANSRAAADEAVALDRVDASRVHCIRNAVLPAGDGFARAAVRAGWSVADDQLIVGSVANYKPEKGLLTLLEVAARLRPSNPGLRYVLVGEGPQRSELEARIDFLDLRSVVILHGAADDARALYPAFDIFVQSSRTEGFPNVVLEAAASGLPIVATDVGGTAEILTTGVDGILVQSMDPAALAAAIDSVAKDPDLRRRLSTASRARTEEFSVARLVAATAALYQGLAASRSAGRSSAGPT